jgi:hypothetical protein
MSDTPIKHEMRTKTIPEDGNYRIDKVVDGRLIITAAGHEYDADPSQVAGVVTEGNFVKIKFDGKRPVIEAVL